MWRFPVIACAGDPMTTPFTTRGARISVLGLLAFPAPANPFGACGEDPTPGLLGCERFAEPTFQLKVKRWSTLFFEMTGPRCYPNKTRMYLYF